MTTPTATTAPNAVVPESLLNVVGATYVGLAHTDPEWLASYVDLRYPVRLPPGAAVQIRSKLMTTGVFTDVHADLEPTAPGSSDYQLVVTVEEKWTMIPVLRGVYGGGTPLRVVGLYDIHTFGRLVTLGGEMRKYGDAPPGFVLYARDPRHAAGRYYVGTELWRNFRIHQLYSRGGDLAGKVATTSTVGRTRVLVPIDGVEPAGAAFAGRHVWKAGLDMQIVQEAPTSFDARVAGNKPPAAAPRDLPLNERVENHAEGLPTLLYDDVEADNLHLDGLRGEAAYGPVFAGGASAGKPRTRGQLEVFYFKLLPAHLNLCLHALAGETTLDTPNSQYFLGGLDSVRGLPDGAIYGTRAAYGNAELRHTSLQTKYLSIQSAAFYDAGIAGPDWSVARQDARAAVGLGVRFAVPQVYRLVLRIDYAWTVDGSRTRGLSAGLNQFFDPYRPL